MLLPALGHTHPQVPAEQHRPGLVVHAVGHPLPWDVYGGSFLYHMPDRRVALGCVACAGHAGAPARLSACSGPVGSAPAGTAPQLVPAHLCSLVVALDYADPHLNLYQEFQQFKRHPWVAAQLRGGTCLQYGARALNEGGWQSIPALAFPGGALVGDAAGFLNVPKIKVGGAGRGEKMHSPASCTACLCRRQLLHPCCPCTLHPQGTHTAMKSGMLAAEAAHAAMAAQPAGAPLDLSAYEAAVRSSWVRWLQGLLLEGAAGTRGGCSTSTYC